MITHTNKILIVRTVDGQEYVKGEAFFPELTEKITDATRMAVMSDAKKFVKTAAKRLKIAENKLKIVPAEETRDENFNLIDVKLVQ